jgi:hypothetical protein
MDLDIDDILQQKNLVRKKNKKINNFIWKKNVQQLKIQLKIFLDQSYEQPSYSQNVNLFTINKQQ